MLDNAGYKNHWETKKQWYDKHFPNRLFTTQEAPTLSNDAEEIINANFQ